jgi:hypothetical protein
MMTRWEYVTIQVVAAGFEDPSGNENYHAILNEYGQQGWELVSVVRYTGRVVTGEILVLFFKRPQGG